jgi:hypothetical protein
MKSQALQQMISKIHSDKAIRAQFMPNGNCDCPIMNLPSRKKPPFLAPGQ